jgi:hypothetical protein
MGSSGRERDDGIFELGEASLRCLSSPVLATWVVWFNNSSQAMRFSLVRIGGRSGHSYITLFVDIDQPRVACATDGGDGQSNRVTGAPLAN